MTQLGLLNAEASAPAERGRVHVHFGDWREAEPSWPRPFAFVSDVPYGIGYKSNMRRNGRRALPDSIKGDRDTSERDEMMAVRGWQAAAVFGPRRLDRVPPWGDPREILSWDKGAEGCMGDLGVPWTGNWETIAIYGPGWTGKRSVGALRHDKPCSAHRDHPHEKPLPLMAELVAKAPPNIPIIDPFLGSGTTAVACALLGREFYGAEIDPQYWPVIRGKLAAVGVVLP